MPITNGYLTLDELASYITPANQTLSVSGSDDSVLEGIITATSRFIDGMTRRTFYARTETHYYDVPDGRELLITDDDLYAVTTLTNGDTEVLTTADYILLPNNSSPKYAIRIKQSSSKYWQGTSAGNDEQAITIVGSWCYATAAPADLKQAMYDICKAIYSRRLGDNVTSEAYVAPGGFVVEPRDISPFAWKTIMRYQRLV